MGSCGIVPVHIERLRHAKRVAAAAAPTLPERGISLQGIEGLPASGTAGAKDATVGRAARGFPPVDVPRLVAPT
jgi:hypothetical protein